MSLPPAVLEQIQKNVNQNVNYYFGPLKPAEKTPEKVKVFAQKQLDFFLSGLARQSMELQKLWAKGHPYYARLRITPGSARFEIDIIEDDGSQ